MRKTFYIRVAGISIRFDVPDGMEIPRDLRNFQIAPTKADETYTVSSLSKFSPPAEQLRYSDKSMRIYELEDGWLRVFADERTENRNAVNCLIRHNGNHELYIPPHIMPRYMGDCIYSCFLVPEYMLLRHGRVILHSSVVVHHGKSVLFCGPSHIGKSTQAELWRAHLGADVINGDRCVISKRNGIYWGSGSPYCGSSGIYRPDEAPIAAVVLLGQAKENAISPASGGMALRTFFRESIQHPWDPDYTQSLLSALTDFAQTVPVFSLHCRPDADAVRLTHTTIFGKEP